MYSLTGNEDESGFVCARVTIGRLSREAPGRQWGAGIIADHAQILHKIFEKFAVYRQGARLTWAGAQEALVASSSAAKGQCSALWQQSVVADRLYQGAFILWSATF